MALEKYLFILGTIGLLVLASMHLLLTYVLDYEIVVFCLSFICPFVLTLGACIKKNVSLSQYSPWGLFIILNSMFFTAPLLSVLYPNQDFLSIKFQLILGPFFFVANYYLLTNTPNKIFLQLKISPVFLYVLVFCTLLFVGVGDKFI